MLQNHFERFEQAYDDRFERDYGFYRQVISDVVYAYLKYGDLKDGFARVRCPDCHYEYLLAFSCRGRWFCPSCHSKKVVQSGKVLRESSLPVRLWPDNLNETPRAEPHAGCRGGENPPATIFGNYCRFLFIIKPYNQHRELRPFFLLSFYQLDVSHSPFQIYGDAEFL